MNATASSRTRRLADARPPLPLLFSCLRNLLDARRAQRAPSSAPAAPAAAGRATPARL